MRAKRRTNSEIQKSGRKSNAHKPVPEELKKVDIFKNNEDLDVDAITEAQRKKEEKLVPMRVNAQTIIYVTPENNNEEYKLNWMEKHGYKLKLKDKIAEPSSGGRCKKPFDKEKALEMLNDAFSISDISKEVGISTSVLYNFFRRNGEHIPVEKERVAILFHKGLSIGEIAARTKLSHRTVELHVNNM